MNHLHSLLLEGLDLLNPPHPIPSLGTQTILSYLHFKYLSSQQHSSMRVVVVGPEKAGKSCLISRLKGESDVSIAPTKGLEVSIAQHCSYSCLAFCTISTD